MEKDTAIKLITIYRGLEDPLNRATEIIGTVKDPNEQKEIRHPLGNFMGRLRTDLMLPIVKQYPELDLDKKTELPLLAES